MRGGRRFADQDTRQIRACARIGAVSCEYVNVGRPVWFRGAENFFYGIAASAQLRQCGRLHRLSHRGNGAALVHDALNRRHQVAAPA
jgi:hypothetical protein